ncbi:mCG147867, isoform CRA_a [Mus musculus]|nr:mCG147867, isoform CRA_a [Mus musculus]
MKISWCYAVQCDFSFLMPKAKDIRLPFFCLTLLRKCIQSPHDAYIHTPQHIQTHTIHTQHMHVTHTHAHIQHTYSTCTHNTQYTYTTWPIHKHFTQNNCFQYIDTRWV